MVCLGLVLGPQGRHPSDLLAAEQTVLRAQFDAITSEAGAERSAI